MDEGADAVVLEDDSADDDCGPSGSHSEDSDSDVQYPAEGLTPPTPMFDDGDAAMKKADHLVLSPAQDVEMQNFPGFKQGCNDTPLS